LGRALSEHLAMAGHELFLVASDRSDLGPLVSDLTIRFGINAYSAPLDLSDFSPPMLRQACLESMGGIDCLFIIAGSCMTDKDFDLLSIEESARLMTVNYTAPVQIIQVFYQNCLKAKTAIAWELAVSLQPAQENVTPFMLPQKEGWNSIFPV